MKVIVDPDEPIETRTSTTIGNFDGVHIGHKRIIKAVKEKARQGELTPCIISFHPHPQKVLRNIDVPLLAPMIERLKLLEREGVDLVVCYTFTKEIAKISAEDFVSDVLVGKLNVRHLVVGQDFSFGSKRQGNINLLKIMGEQHDFDTMVIDPARIDDEVVSSTAIRNLIREGNVKKAERFLGYNFSIDGRVKIGERRGRRIGFPTANLDTDWDVLPKVGVYATLAHVDGAVLNSITNVGYRPTFGNNELLIEIHVLDFNKDIYDKRIRIEFVDRVRDERKFNGAYALVQQIKKDVQNVKRLLLSN